MKEREIGPESILQVLNDHITIDDVTPIMRGYVNDFLISPEFFNIFCVEFKKRFNSLHEVPLNWESYDRMAKHLDGRLKSWRMPNVHN